MASSGSFNTNAYSSRYLTFSWSVQSQSIANNTTTISWSLKGAGGGSTYYKSGNFKVVINGSVVYSSATRIELRNGTTVASGTFTMSHDNNGNKTFSASAEAGIYYVAVNCSGSGTWTLPQIPRYATSNQTLSSKTETSITMNWSSDNVVDYIWYSSNNGSSWTGINVADGKSGSYTISGLTANTTYNIKTRVRRKDSQLTTDSSATSITTYAYPYANSMPNFTIGDTLTIGIYNPLGRTYTVTVIANDNSQMAESSSYSGTSISGFKTTSYINFWYASIPSSKTGTYKVKVTYGNISTTKTGGTYTVNPSDCLPIIGNTSYQDTNSTVTAITGNNQLIVRSQSTVQFTASNLVGNKSATISSCSVAINGTSYNMTVSSNSATVSNITIDSSQDVTATFTLTDSRGVTNTTNLNVTMLDWVLPTAIISCQRQSNYYSSTDINVNADYSSVDEKNTITIKVRSKKTSDSSYGSYTTLSDGVTSTITLDNLYEWDVQVLVSDLFGSTTYNLVIPIGMPIMYIDRILNAIGFNSFPTNQYGVSISGVDVLKAIQGIELYADTTGTEGTVILDDNASNYNKFYIEFIDNDGTVGSKEVTSPNGKNVYLSITYPGSVSYKKDVIDVPLMETITSFL